MIFIDAGNSTIKIKREDSPIERFESESDAIDYLSADDANVWCSSVRRGEFVSSLQRSIRRQGITLHLIDYQSQGLLHTQYERPDRLGIDRLIAVSEAYQRYGDCMVVDIGTAMTVDFVEQGVHVGGYIVPGVATMINSLGVATSDVKVNFDQDIIGQWLPAVNTQGAVVQGVTHAIVAQIEYHRAKWNNDCATIVVTGGAAIMISKYLHEDIVVIDELVLKGIERLSKVDEKSGEM